MRDSSRATDKQRGAGDETDDRAPRRDTTSVGRRGVLAGAGGLAALATTGLTAGIVGGAERGDGRTGAVDLKRYGSSVDDPALERHIEEYDLPTPPTLADINTRRTRDAVDDLGLDPTGSDPIEDELSDAINNGDRIEFPDGTYRVASAIHVSGHANFALVGTGDATFVLDSGTIGNVLSYRDCRDCAFAGIDIDQSADECSAQTAFNTEGVLVVRDVEFIGFSDPDDSGKKVGFNVRDGDGAATFKNVVATDGTVVGRNGVDHNDVHKQEYDGGYWAGPPHEGTAYFIDCEAANWADNGLYASRTNGGIVVIGGYYANSSISQVRLGHPESFVGGGCHLVVDRDEIPAENNPDGLAFTRSIWLESGGLDNDGATVGRCNIRVGDVGSFGGCVKVSSSGANARIEGTAEVIAPEDIRRINASPPIHVSDGAVRNVTSFSDDGWEDPIGEADSEEEIDVDTEADDDADPTPRDRRHGLGHCYLPYPY